MSRSAFRSGSRQARRRRGIDRLKVAAAVERSRQYQRLLRRAASLSEQFQKQLDATQLSAWLSLEEALLALAAHGNEEYFKAGVVIGRRQGRSGSDGGASPRIEPCDAELAQTIVRLIRRIARQ